jgi:hypothetical protein
MQDPYKSHRKTIEKHQGTILLDWLKPYDSLMQKVIERSPNWTIQDLQSITWTVEDPIGSSCWSKEKWTEIYAINRDGFCQNIESLAVNSSSSSSWSCSVFHMAIFRQTHTTRPGNVRHTPRADRLLLKRGHRSWRFEAEDLEQRYIAKDLWTVGHWFVDRWTLLRWLVHYSLWLVHYD